MRRAATALAVVIWGWMGVAGVASAAPALWRVSDADSEIYLFGTLHALTPGAEWRTPAYDAAYAKAGALWFEADMERGDPTTVAAILERYGYDTQHRLSEKLDARDLKVLARQADVSRIEHLRPWAAALMLSMQPAMTRGVTLEAGADLTMTRAARQGAKQVRTFETLEDQARMFASLSERAEVRYLSGVIRERSQPRLALRPPQSLEDAWLAGDLARLGPGLVGEMKAENPDFYDALLKGRNLAWAEKLTEAMAGAGVELVNVGALHMVGDDGLPTLMAARGFKVERVQ